MIVTAYNSADFINTCKKIGGDNWNDLRGDIALKMYELSDERYNAIRNVKGFMIMSAYNLGLDHIRKSNKLKFESGVEDMADIVNDKAASEAIINKILKDYDDNKRFYHARVFIYSEMYGSVKKLSGETGIPYKELLTIYKEYVQYLRHIFKK